MEKKMCNRVVQDLKQLLGDDVANDLICGFLRASDAELREIQQSLEAFMKPALVGAAQ